MKRIYLDHAALTPIDKRVVKEMKKYSSGEYGNPSSIHVEGVEAKKALEESRKSAAAFLHALSHEIIFTGSGTEANNMGIIGLAEQLVSSGKKYDDLHMITSVIEHPSVLECARYLERKGVRVQYVPVDENGIVILDEIKKAIRPETFLISIMTVNNEIGTVQPIAEISKIIRHSSQKIIFHTDASQAPCYLELNVEKLGVTMLTLDAHKIYGPRGIGLLYIKRGTAVTPRIYGGGQEKGMRSGTESLPAVMGFSKALEIAKAAREKENSRVSLLRDYCIAEIKDNIPHSILNGDPINRIAHIINISIPAIDNEYVVLALDAKGIAIATKSSCLRDEQASYVVRSLGRGDDVARASLRISLGRGTTKKDIDYFMRQLVKIVYRNI